jgi:hypothetical protein
MSKSVGRYAAMMVLSSRGRPAPEGCMAFTGGLFIVIMATPSAPTAIVDTGDILKCSAYVFGPNSIQNGRPCGLPEG